MSGEQKESFVAEAMDPLGADSEYLTKMIFAENAPGGPEAWVNIGNAALNRLRSGKFGKSLKSVINGMSAAISTKSPQWQKALKGEFNDYERRVYNKIKQVADGLVGGKIPDTVKGATHFENLNAYPMPYWAKGMDAVARDRSGPKQFQQTYFKLKAQPSKVGEVSANGDGQRRLER